MEIMKVKVSKATQEGFISNLQLEFDNGLLLSTGSRNLLFTTGKTREETVKKFEEVVDQLKVAGFEVER